MGGKVFISYSSADQETADKLVAEIEHRSIPCWISSRDIRPGEDYQRAIVTALKESPVLLLLFSENANKSTEIPRELALAGKYKKTVIPARIQDIVPSEAFAYQMTSAQFIDLFHDFNAKLDELCVRLAELLQISETVAERIRLDNQIRLEKERRTAFRAKLKRMMKGAVAVIAIIGSGVGGLWIYVHRISAPSTNIGAGNPSVDQRPPPSIGTNHRASVILPPFAAAGAPSITAPPPLIPSVAMPVRSLPEIVVPPSLQHPTPNVPATGRPTASSDMPPFKLNGGSVADYAQAIRSALGSLAPISPSIAGKYVDGAGREYELYGPGVSVAGQTSWSIQLKVGQVSNGRFEAAWTTGPLDMNPDLVSQGHLDTLPPGLTYGMGSGSDGRTRLVGLRMLDGAIEIQTFLYNSGWQVKDARTLSRPTK